MNPWFLAAGVSSAATLGVHAFVGGRLFARPLLATRDLRRVVRLTLYYCWHIVTVMLAGVAGAFFLAALRPEETMLAGAATALAGACALLSLSIVLAHRMNPLHMPQWSFFAVTAGIGAIGLLAGAPADGARTLAEVAAAHEEQREALERAHAEFAEALAARDAERLATLFMDDAVVQVAGMPPIEGRAAIGPFYENLFGFLTSSTVVPEVTRMSAGGHMAYSTGRTTNAFAGPDGPVEYAGKYALIWQELGGEWRIAVYSVSSNEPDEP